MDADRSALRSHSELARRSNANDQTCIGSGASEMVVTLLDLSRWQLAFAVMFHMSSPSITVGLSIFLCALYGMYLKTGSAIYLQMF